ncbi:MAG: hypothetical protein F4X65_03155 [Chloroflexi bacterium]|nr:hypothetical protein [Chloroflexota bacterium]
MKFMIDRCAGRRLAAWLRNNGHDVLEAHALGPDPGDEALLERAAAEGRVFITLDKDYGELIFLHRVSHSGLIRLPDLTMSERIALVEKLIKDYRSQMELGCVITIQAGRVRTSSPTDYRHQANDNHK